MSSSESNNLNKPSVLRPYGKIVVEVRRLRHEDLTNALRISALLQQSIHTQDWLESLTLAFFLRISISIEQITKYSHHRDAAIPLTH